MCRCAMLWQMGTWVLGEGGTTERDTLTLGATLRRYRLAAGLWQERGTVDGGRQRH